MFYSISFFNSGILLQQSIAPLEGVSVHFSNMYCIILKEMREWEIFNHPGWMSQQPLDPFSSDLVVKQKWQYFQDFVGTQKIEGLSESKTFRRSISNNK